MNAFAIIRRTVLGGSVVVAALVLLRLLGASDLACGAGCVAANSSTFARWISIVYVVGSCVAVVAEFQKGEALRSALFLCMGAASIGGFMAMVASHHLFALCIAGQAAWFLLGTLQLFRLNRWAGALALVIPAYVVYSLTSTFSGHLVADVPFEIRNGEAYAKNEPHAIIVFADPLCEHCQAAARKVAADASPVPIFYRWYLLPQNGQRSVVLAAAIESALTLDYQKGLAFQHRVMAGPQKPSDADIVKSGLAAGFIKSQVEEWLRHPDSGSLQVLEEDAKLAKVCGVSRIPDVFAASSTLSYSPHVTRLHPGELRSLSEATKKNFLVLNPYFGENP